MVLSLQACPPQPYMHLSSAGYVPLGQPIILLDLTFKDVLHPVRVRGGAVEALRCKPEGGWFDFCCGHCIDVILPAAGPGV